MATKEQMMLGDVVVDVLRKDIKNIHLSVHPPTGRVRIAAPLRISLDTLRVFAISKLAWIRQQQQKLQAQDRETPREYLNRESHYVWGQRYLLTIATHDAAPAIEIKHNKLVLHVRATASAAKRQAVLDAWYREQLRAAISPLIAKWEALMNVAVTQFFVQRMKTRWGSCNACARTIRLNTELAKKPSECLEYIVVHEMVHLVEPTHNARFVALMDGWLPKWRFYREALNRLPVRHEDWAY
jgi:hypothetical protein